MSRILVTGNPNYEGLCKGIYEAYNHNRVEFIGRWNGWDLGDFKKVADHAKDFDVFVNSQYGTDNEQVDILNAVYNKFERGHIIARLTQKRTFTFQAWRLYSNAFYKCL